MLCIFYFTKGNVFFESSSIETAKFEQVKNKIIDFKNNKTSLYKTETFYQEIIKMKNAADRNRTGTGITTHGILSPGRLPVPPLRHILFSYIPIAEIRRIRASTVALSRYVNGRRWIRTTEGSASRFTVCPLWPLGNSPMAFSSSNDDTIEKRKNQYFF